VEAAWLTLTDSPSTGIALAMEKVGDIDYHSRMSRAARQRADASDDPDLARRLREAAIKHERRVRLLRRQARGSTA